MIEVQTIECRNNATFDMSFKVRSSDKTSGSSDRCSIHESQSIELSGAGFDEGALVWAEVDAYQGKTSSSSDHIVFKKNGKKAIFNIQGATLNYSVTYEGTSEDSVVLPDFPAHIPVAQKPFKNWDGFIDIPSIWTATPSVDTEVVEICNWAKDNAYTVRATGIKHTWSPITVPASLPSSTKVLLVDTSKLNSISMITASEGQPPMVRLGTGATMGELLAFLEEQEGNGAAPGYSFANVPAPEHLTVGGVLAINGHGTSIKLPPSDAFGIGYGSMSNNIMELKAVVTTENDPETYELVTFKRGEEGAEVLMTHLGRTVIVEVVLQVIDNYNLRCQSFTDISADTLFAEPTGSTPPPKSFTEFLQNSGRVEAIWFPFTDNPWLKVWTVAPTQPVGSKKVGSPNNYTFSDNLPNWVVSIINAMMGGFPSLTPYFGKIGYTITDGGLTLTDTRDLWGPSKNTLFYIKDSTLRVTANGYAVLMKRENVQNAVCLFAKQFENMLTAYEQEGKFPINSPLEIRVTSLDEYPLISSLVADEVVKENGWDVALWLDVLTIPGTKYSNEFYTELEEWFVQTFNGETAMVRPEWSKGWAYTKDGGAWTNSAFLQRVRDSFNDWEHEKAKLNTYDRFNLFTTDLLKRLF